MRIYFNFKIRDGIKTENFVEDDIDTLEEKVSKYDIGSSELQKLFLKPVKIILESTYPVKIVLKENLERDDN